MANFIFYLFFFVCFLFCFLFFAHAEKDEPPGGVVDGEDIDEINVSLLSIGIRSCPTCFRYIIPLITK